MNNIKWVSKIKLASGETHAHECIGQRLEARVNDHGDLTIYRTHPDMYVEPVVANYAAGTWVFQETEGEEE